MDSKENTQNNASSNTSPRKIAPRTGTGPRPSAGPRRANSSGHRPGPRTRNGKPPFKKKRFDRRRPQMQKPLRTSGKAPLKDVETLQLPTLTEDQVRIIPLGGVEEVGRNMTAVETPEGIIISDAGFQFMSEEQAPGIDYVLPNTRWLEENKDRIIALFITHGHLDHIGGIPYLIDRIGNPPIYTRYLTSLMIKKRHEEFPHLPPINMNTVEVGGRVQIGEEGKKVLIKTFPVTHSIPDSMGLSIETKHGNIVISGDLKLDHEDGTPTDAEQKVWG